MAQTRKKTPASLASESTPLLAQDVDQMLLTKDNPEQADSNKPRLCSYQDIPAWAQDNIYIHTGYRIPTNSYSLCFKSLFYLSNETGNIYSVLLGCFIFIIIAFLSLENLFVSTSVVWFDYFFIYIYIGSAIVCFGCSTWFHLVCCRSENGCKTWVKCDFAGIAFLITGSFFPIIYYAFFCDFIISFVYLSVITFLGAVTLIFSVSNKYSTPKYRSQLTGLFLAMCLSGLVPAVHILILDGVEELYHNETFTYIFLMGGLYIAGAVTYYLRIPERWYPGFFDYWFQSHQLFHVFVVIAAIFNFIGVVTAYDLAHSESKKCL